MVASLMVRNVQSEKTFDELYAKLTEYDLIRYVFDEGSYDSKRKEAYFSSWEEQHWRYYSADMQIIAESFPSLVFELTCQSGNEYWRVYYQDMSNEVCSGEVIYQAPEKIKWDALAPF